MERWMDNDSIYNEDIIEEMVDEDELSPEEEAFMRGYIEEHTSEVNDYY